MRNRTQEPMHQILVHGANSGQQFQREAKPGISLLGGAVPRRDVNRFDSRHTRQHDTSDHSHTIRIVNMAETRKTPQQRRSREMVERILAAGRTVVLRDGYDAASTNRIAAEAGVSPGSLYQYFPNKDAVLSAIVGRYSDDVSERITAALADRFDETGPEMVRATLEALLDALEDNTELLRIVADELPRNENRTRAEALEERVTGLVSAYLAARPPQMRNDLAPTTAAWIVVRAIEHMTVRYVLDRPAIERTTFVAEVERLVTRYLVDLPLDAG